MYKKKNATYFAGYEYPLDLLVEAWRMLLADIHNSLDEIHSLVFFFFWFFAYLPTLSEAPICPRNMKLIRYGLKKQFSKFDI